MKHWVWLLGLLVSVGSKRRSNAAFGFQTFPPVETPVELNFTGKVPTWIAGDMYRNTPGVYEMGPDQVRHWFDPFSMLHKFRFSNGKVTHMSKILDTPSYHDAKEAGRMV